MMMIANLENTDMPRNEEREASKIPRRKLKLFLHRKSSNEQKLKEHSKFSEYKGQGPSFSENLQYNWI